MKKEFVAGLIAVLLVISSALVLYIFVVRTSSGQKVTQFSETVRFLGERVDSLEKQRDLLSEAASSLEAESEGLKKRVRQIDAEIQNMREILTSAGTRPGTVAFSWRRFQVTTASGLVIVAFLAFIWMLYGTSKHDESGDEPPALEETAEAGGEEENPPIPGSVLEEEFPAESGDEAREEAPPGEDDQKEEA